MSTAIQGWHSEVISQYSKPLRVARVLLRWFLVEHDDAARRQVCLYGKQKRQAEHIEEGYEHRGVPEGEAERRAWATVNKETGGGKKSGSGRGASVDRAPSRKGGGKLGGQARFASGKGAIRFSKRERPRAKARPRTDRLPSYTLAFLMDPQPETALSVLVATKETTGDRR